MQNLIILGTGVHAAEMAHIVERINRVSPTWNLLGHVAEKETSETMFYGYPLLDAASRLENIVANYPDAMLVEAYGFPRDNSVTKNRLATLIDPSCYIHPSARIGRGCVMFPHGFVGLNAVIGDHVFMLAGCLINHDVVMEDRVVAASAVTLAGSVHIEAGVYLGQSCCVRQFLRIGRNSLIGMGAVVVKDVEPDSVMIGNPARKQIKPNSHSQGGPL